MSPETEAKSEPTGDSDAVAEASDDTGADRGGESAEPDTEAK